MMPTTRLETPSGAAETPVCATCLEFVKGPVYVYCCGAYILHYHEVCMPKNVRKHLDANEVRKNWSDGPLVI